MDEVPTINYDKLRTQVKNVLKEFLQDNADNKEVNTEWVNAYLEIKESGKFFSSKTRVPDVWRCFKFQKTFSLQCNSYRILNPIVHGWIDVKIGGMSPALREKVVKNGSIVFILESPHQHEYEYPIKGDGLPIPIAPAQGTTGNAILKLYEMAVEKWGEAFFEMHPLIIINPVPWQTSLHYFHNYPLHSRNGQAIRNNVWKAIWKFSQDNTQPILDNFLQRMDSYNPAVIVNACTGKGKYGLWSLVQNALKKRQPISSHHPSSTKFNTSYQEKLLADIDDRLEKKSARS